jgi:superfamily II DNA helicase RecQ
MNNAMEYLDEKVIEIGYENWRKFQSVNTTKQHYLFLYKSIEDLIKERDNLDKQNESLKKFNLEKHFETEELKKELNSTIEKQSTTIEDLQDRLLKVQEENKSLKKEENFWHQLADGLSDRIDSSKKFVDKDYYPRWVDCVDRLPKDENEYFFCKREKYLNYVTKKEKFNFYSITHWLEEEPEPKEMTYSEKETAIIEDAEMKLMKQYAKPVTTDQNSFDTLTQEEIKKLKSFLNNLK